MASAQTLLLFTLPVADVLAFAQTILAAGQLARIAACRFLAHGGRCGMAFGPGARHGFLRFEALLVGVPSVSPNCAAFLSSQTGHCHRGL